MTKGKNLILNLLLLFMAFVFVFIILEAATYIFVKIPRFDMQLNDIWYGGIPYKRGIYQTSEFKSHYEFNSMGFRDYNHSIQKDKSTCRIAVLGDSFAESMEVELNESWPRLLEKKLKEKTRKDVEVINFGLNGAGTSTEYFTMERYAFQFKPDIVLLLFFNGNDVNDNYFEPTGKYFRLDKDGNLVEVAQSGNKNILKNILRKSRFVIIAKKSYDTLRYRLNENNMVKYYGVFLKNYSKEWNEAWSITKKIILKMDSSSKDNNSTFIMAVASSKEQLDPAIWKKLESKYTLLAQEGWDMKKPNKILSGFCQQNNITCFDPHDDFQNAIKRGKKLHFNIDNHWTKEGHAEFSDYLSNAMSRSLMQACK